MYLWYKQLGLNSRTPKNLKELVIFGHKRNQRNVELACSTNLERVFSPLDLSGVSNFALCITMLLLLLMDRFCCICTKNIYNCRKDEEVVTLLRSYAKQISINAMKKIGAPLLGLAKYIYYSLLPWYWRAWEQNPKRLRIEWIELQLSNDSDLRRTLFCSSHYWLVSYNLWRSVSFLSFQTDYKPAKTISKTSCAFSTGSPWLWGWFPPLLWSNTETSEKSVWFTTHVSLILTKNIGDRRYGARSIRAKFPIRISKLFVWTFRLNGIFHFKGPVVVLDEWLCSSEVSIECKFFFIVLGHRIFDQPYFKL